MNQDSLKGLMSKNLESENPSVQAFKRYVPKTVMGRKIQSGYYKTLSELLDSQRVIEPDALDLFEQKLISRVVSVSRISHTLRSGKIYQFRVVVIVGNKQGLVGVGTSKAVAKVRAIRKAQKEAKKNLVSLKALKHDSLDSYSPVKKTFYKMGATRVTVSPLTGNSITASKNGKVYCELSGLKNIKIYVGSKKRQRKGKVGSSMNYFKALHEAVKKQT